MNENEKRKYVFAQLSSLPNAFQYVEVTNYIEKLEKKLTDYKERIEKAIEYIKDSIYIPDDEDDMMFEKILSLTDNQIDELVGILDKKDKE